MMKAWTVILFTICLHAFGAPPSIYIRYHHTSPSNLGVPPQEILKIGDDQIELLDDGTIKITFEIEDTGHFSLNPFRSRFPKKLKRHFILRNEIASLLKEVLTREDGLVFVTRTAGEAPFADRRLHREDHTIPGGLSIGLSDEVNFTVQDNSFAKENEVTIQAASLQVHIFDYDFITERSWWSGKKNIKLDQNFRNKVFRFDSHQDIAQQFRSGIADHFHIFKLRFLPLFSQSDGVLWGFFLKDLENRTRNAHAIKTRPQVTEQSKQRLSIRLYQIPAEAVRFAKENDFENWGRTEVFFEKIHEGPPIIDQYQAVTISIEALDRFLKGDLSILREEVGPQVKPRNGERTEVTLSTIIPRKGVAHRCLAVLHAANEELPNELLQ